MAASWVRLSRARVDDSVTLDDEEAEMYYGRTSRHVPRGNSSNNVHHTVRGPWPPPRNADQAIPSIEEAAEDEVAEIIDLTAEDYYSAGSRDFVQDREASYDSEELSEHTRPDGLVLVPDTTVELLEPIGKYLVRFLKIQSIVRDQRTGKTILRGFAFARARDMRGMLEKKLNECCLISPMNHLDPRPWHQQGTFEVEPQAVKGWREMRMTNAPFPRYRFLEADLQERGLDWVAENGPLVCRHVFLEYFNGNAGRKQNKPCELALARVREEEADEQYAVQDRILSCRWRGVRTPHGTERTNMKYTAGDTFAGGGGASRGIKSAGLDLRFSVDHWAPAIASLRQNFPTTNVIDMDVTDFISARQYNYRVDILHLSPPCQVWSPAHTVPGQNDEANEAILYSCDLLLKKVRPRLFTLEQTFGILAPRYEPNFNKLLQGFVSHGYSVRWKVAHLVTLGLPQPRRRLIMIGAGPGEKLPSFPEPTHSKGGEGGLKPFTTVRQAVAHLQNLPEQRLQLQKARQFNPPKPRWDPDKPLAYTITCNGGGAAADMNHHWDGLRVFTPLELAALQGFPAHHKFVGSLTDVKKQIGNAFPSSVVKVLYQHLVAHLKEQDSKAAADLGRRTGIPHDNDDVLEVDGFDLPLPGRRAATIDLLSDSDSDIMDIDDDANYSGGSSGGSTPNSSQSSGSSIAYYSDDRSETMCLTPRSSSPQSDVWDDEDVAMGGTSPANNTHLSNMSGQQRPQVIDLTGGSGIAPKRASVAERRRRKKQAAPAPAPSPSLQPDGSYGSPFEIAD